MIETISGIIAAVALIIITQVFSKYFTTKLIAATMLVAIAFIYVGFSLKTNPVSSIILESIFAVALYFIALIGYKGNNLLLAYGIILHGIWDIFHHDSLLIKTDVPVFWPSFCFIIDIIDGIYFWIVLGKKRIA